MTLSRIFLYVTAVTLFGSVVVLALSGIVGAAIWTFQHYGLLGVPVACVVAGLAVTLVVAIVRHGP